MAAAANLKNHKNPVRHLRFLKLKALKKPFLRRTKFRKNRSNLCGDNAIFVIFNRAAATIANF